MNLSGQGDPSSPKNYKKEPTAKRTLIPPRLKGRQKKTVVPATVETNIGIEVIEANDLLGRKIEALHIAENDITVTLTGGRRLYLSLDGGRLVGKVTGNDDD